MKTLEILLSRRWILKDRDRELYYRMRDEVGTVKRFLTEKLGYQVIVNPYLIKVEKIPAEPLGWMGILEFSDQMEYVFLCMVLMFLEEKDAREQFVLSELTEYIASQWRQTQIDWTKYVYRRQLVKVLKYCTSCGMLQVDDGNEDSFSRDLSGEVLYENTGVSRYFMKNFTQDIMEYTTPADFLKEEWIDADEDRGIVRRQRVYRRLLMTMGMYKNADTEEDFNYLRNYRYMISADLSGMLDCELQVHRTSAYLILDEECRMGRCFPEDRTLSDIVLLVNGMLQEKIRAGEITPGPQEQILMPEADFRNFIEDCRERYAAGFAKSYRDMTGAELYGAVSSYMEELDLIRKGREEIMISPAAGKIAGRYPADFRDRVDADRGEETK